MNVGFSTFGLKETQVTPHRATLNEELHDILE